MRKTFLAATLCLLTCTYAHADGPKYEVFTQLDALAVSYHVESNKREIILYAINHEKKPIICDANMATNKQEKSKAVETPITPGKTHAFTFTHRTSITDVKLYLICEADKNQIDEISAPQEQKLPQDTKLPEPTKIIEEDLNKI